MTDPKPTTPGTPQENDNEDAAARIRELELNLNVAYKSVSILHGQLVKAVGDRETVEATRDALVEALRRLLRSFEADVEMVPNVDVKTCWETNSQAIAAARAALEKAGKAGAL